MTYPILLLCLIASLLPSAIYASGAVFAADIADATLDVRKGADIPAAWGGLHARAAAGRCVDYVLESNPSNITTTLHEVVGQVYVLPSGRIDPDGGSVLRLSVTLRAPTHHFAAHSPANLVAFIMTQLPRNAALDRQHVLNSAHMHVTMAADCTKHGAVVDVPVPAQLFQCVANSETGEHSRVLFVGLQLTLSSKACGAPEQVLHAGEADDEDSPLSYMVVTATCRPQHCAQQGRRRLSSAPVNKGDRIRGPLPVRHATSATAELATAILGGSAFLGTVAALFAWTSRTVRKPVHRPAAIGAFETTTAPTAAVASFGKLSSASVRRRATSDGLAVFSAQWSAREESEDGSCRSSAQRQPELPPDGPLLRKLTRAYSSHSADQRLPTYRRNAITTCLDTDSFSSNNQEPRRRLSAPGFTSPLRPTLTTSQSSRFHCSATGSGAPPTLPPPPRLSHSRPAVEGQPDRPLHVAPVPVPPAHATGPTPQVLQPPRERTSSPGSCLHLAGGQTPAARCQTHQPPKRLSVPGNCGLLSTVIVLPSARPACGQLGACRGPSSGGCLPGVVPAAVRSSSMPPAPPMRVSAPGNLLLGPQPERAELGGGESFSFTRQQQQQLQHMKNALLPRYHSEL